MDYADVVLKLEFGSSVLVVLAESNWLPNDFRNSVAVLDRQIVQKSWRYSHENDCFTGPWLFVFYLRTSHIAQPAIRTPPRNIPKQYSP